MWLKKKKRTDEQIADLLVGRKVSTSFVHPDTNGIPIERNFDVKTFLRFLPDRGESGIGLIQFVAIEGGVRTVDVSHIVGIR